MDSFGVKVFHKNNADHFLPSPIKYYLVSTDWDGKNYLGLSINWDYEKGQINISTPDYITKDLAHFQHLKQKNHNTHDTIGQFLSTTNNSKWPQNNTQHPF